MESKRFFFVAWVCSAHFQDVRFREKTWQITPGKLSWKHIGRLVGTSQNWGGNLVMAGQPTPPLTYPSQKWILRWWWTLRPAKHCWDTVSALWSCWWRTWRWRASISNFTMGVSCAGLGSMLRSHLEQHASETGISWKRPSHKLEPPLI